MEGTLGLFEILAITGTAAVGIVTLIFMKDKAINDKIYDLGQQCLRRDELGRELEPLRNNDLQIMRKQDKLEAKLDKVIEAHYNKLGVS